MNLLYQKGPSLDELLRNTNTLVREEGFQGAEREERSLKKEKRNGFPSLSLLMAYLPPAARITILP